MKIATFLAVAIAIFTSIPLLAQQVNESASANDSAKTTYAPTAGGFGDESASHAWEMSSITGELEGKLDSKTAKVGDRVVLKTAGKAQTSDGTVIPKGSLLIGHITEVQAYSKERGFAQMGIAFNSAELKNGQHVAIYTLIRGVNLSSSAMAANSMNDDDMVSARRGGGEMMGGGPTMSGARDADGVMGGTGGPVNGIGGLAGGMPDRTDATASSIGERAGAGLGTAPDTAVQRAGHGAPDLSNGAHAAAAARAVPHPTLIPGVMLAGNSSASGVFSAYRQNILFDSGMQMQLGIVTR